MANERTSEEARLTEYLLAQMSEREREEMEESYFADDAAFEQMLAAEAELIDAYARRELSAEERGRFEARFLSTPQGRERVRFARSLASAVADARPVAPTAAASNARPAAVSDAWRAGATPKLTRPPRRSLFASLSLRSVAARLALAAAVLAVVVAFPLLLIERVRMRDELRQLRGESATLRERAQASEQSSDAERKRNEDLLAQLEAARARPSPDAREQQDYSVRRADAPRQAADSRQYDTARQARTSPGGVDGRRATRPSVLSFRLTPGLVRGGGARALSVPGGVSSVVLRLSAEADNHATYRVLLETAGGREVWRADDVGPQRTSRPGLTIVLPAIPAKDLPPGDYVMLLSGRRPDGGFDGVADYSFRIRRR